MSSYPEPSPKPTWDLLARSFAFRANARFTGLLCPAFFQQAAARHGVRFGEADHHTFNPPVTLWACLTQVLSLAKSCSAAATRVLVLYCSLGRRLPSADNSAFCKARAKLPENFLAELALGLGHQVEAAAGADWKWKGRTVKVADGSIVHLRDTPEILQQYPQQRRQRPGTSYTCMRLVVLFALATAVVVDAGVGPYKGKNASEMALVLPLLQRLLPGELLLADRAYCAYVLFALLQHKRADGCIRLHVEREASFGRGQRLGEDDYLHHWVKPSKRPKYITAQLWASLPDELTVRVVRFQHSRKGFRTKEVYLATTLLDPRQYSREELAELYAQRWQGELDLRSVKQTLGMKMLQGGTPERVRGELWSHLLGYNLVRCVQAQVAYDKGVKPRQLSFSGAVRTLDEFRWLLCCSEMGAEQLAQVLSAAIATHEVGNRPGRYEPREIKRKQRKYPELRKSRQQRRQELAEPEPDKKKRRAKGKHTRS